MRLRCELKRLRIDREHNYLAMEPKAISCWGQGSAAVEAKGETWLIGHEIHAAFSLKVSLKKSQHSCLADEMASSELVGLQAYFQRDLQRLAVRAER